MGLTEGSCEDEAGNGIEATFKTITIDRRAPTCQIETEEGVITNKDSVIYKIKFSEEVQGITADIINVENCIFMLFEGVNILYIISYKYSKW